MSFFFLLLLRRRDKLNWIETLKEKILRGVGRENASNTRIEQYNLSSINISGIIPQFLNGTVPDEDQIAEKIRSYYPACKYFYPLYLSFEDKVIF